MPVALAFVLQGQNNPSDAGAGHAADQGPMYEQGDKPGSDKKETAARHPDHIHAGSAGSSQHILRGGLQELLQNMLPYVAAAEHPPSGATVDAAASSTNIVREDVDGTPHQGQRH